MKNSGFDAELHTVYFYIIFMTKSLILKKKIKKEVENVWKFDKKII